MPLYVTAMRWRDCPVTVYFDWLQCDLDEPCDPRVQCTNLVPGYKCGQCPPGYTSVGPSQGIGGTKRTDEARHRCVDIDECADGRNAGCALNSQCINIEVRIFPRVFLRWTMSGVKNIFSWNLKLYKLQ